MQLAIVYPARQQGGAPISTITAQGATKPDNQLYSAAVAVVQPLASPMYACMKVILIPCSRACCKSQSDVAGPKALQLSSRV